MRLDSWFNDYFHWLVFAPLVFVLFFIFHLAPFIFDSDNIQGISKVPTKNQSVKVSAQPVETSVVPQGANIAVWIWLKSGWFISQMTDEVYTQKMIKSLEDFWLKTQMFVYDSDNNYVPVLRWDENCWVRYLSLELLFM